KAGYARNYLIPKGVANLATKGNVKEIEHHKRVVAERVAKLRKDGISERDRLQQVVLNIEMQAGEEGKLFGSVKTANIAELLAEKGYKIDRRKIDLAQPIKELGEYKVKIQLYRDVVALIQVNVVAAE
ncbi:MAG: 50S ribosomal protein L9, partial [Deltaproteobacteria bacterium]|nr:50S ribosomal protein L9 [Deltaproteobacteria bacterium]